MIRISVAISLVLNFDYIFKDLKAKSNKKTCGCPLPIANQMLSICRTVCFGYDDY